MSEQEEIILFERIRESIAGAQKKMLERKIKLNEPVIVADSNGMPMEISAEQAMLLFNNNSHSDQNITMNL